MKKIVINNVSYEVIKDDFNTIDVSLLETKITDFFDPYDYIVGDWSYGKLRLKGFYETKNKKCGISNNINNLKDYLDSFCAYGCKWFQIKKINDR